MPEPEQDIIQWLVKFIERNYSLITEQWTAQVQRDIPAYQSRPKPELRRTVGEHLNGILQFLAHNSYDTLVSFIKAIATLRASQNFSLADIQKAFLTGKGIIWSLARKSLKDEPEKVLAVYCALEAPFARTLYEHADIYQQLQIDQAKHQAHTIAKMQEEQRYLKEIQREKEKHELIIEAVGIDVALLNQDMQIEWSYSYLRGGKLIRDDRVNHSCSVLDWHESGGCENCAAKRSFVSGKTERGIAEKKDDWGKTRYFQIVSKPISNAEGSITHVLEFVHEITDLCELQKRLAAQHEIHSAIVIGSSDAIIGLDSKGLITSWNPSAENIFGYAEHQVLGHVVHEFLPEMMKELEALPANKSSESVEVKCLSNKGEVILTEARKSTIYDVSGANIGTSLIIRDITERRLLMEKVLQTERMALVGQMATKIAHEIRNPLSSISLNSELLMDELVSFPDAKTKEAKELLRSIANEVDRLVNLTEEYLAFSRLPRPKFDQSNINELIEHLSDFIKPEIKRHKVKLTTVLDKKIPVMEMDKAQMRRAVLNLVRNSLDAMPSGGNLTLATETFDSQLTIKIHDTGEGISKANLRNIFNPFFSTKSTGTGLGLSISQQIVEEHGGHLTCESKMGKGTTFCIFLPVKPECKAKPSKS
jgi:PAS domain S-box-containing protein